jgi:hypothetical protein
MSPFTENAMKKDAKVGDWQTKALTYSYTHARQEEEMGVAVPEVSLSVQRIFLFIPAFRPRFAFFSALFVHITLGYLSPLPHIGPTYNLTLSRELLLHLQGRMSSYLLVLLRSSTWWHEFFIFSSYFLSFPPSLRFLLRYCQQKLGLKKRSWEEKVVTVKLRYSLLYSWAYFAFLLMIGGKKFWSDAVLYGKCSCSVVSNGKRNWMLLQTTVNWITEFPGITHVHGLKSVIFFCLTERIALKITKD